MSGQRVRQATSLVTRFRDIERRLQKLEHNAGVANSTQVLGSGGQDLVDVGYFGGGSYGLRVKDNSGNVRLIAGEDSSIPGNFGVRVNDASGNDIWDSEGLQRTASVLDHYSTDGGLAAFTPTTSWATVSGTSRSFTVSNRAQNVMVLSSIAPWCSYTSGDAIYVYFRLYLANGTGTPSSSGILVNNSANATANITKFVYIASLNPGTYSYYWQGSITSGTGPPCNAFTFETAVLQLGS